MIIVEEELTFNILLLLLLFISVHLNIMFKGPQMFQKINKTNMF